MFVYFFICVESSGWRNSESAYEIVRTALVTSKIDVTTPSYDGYQLLHMLFLKLWMRIERSGFDIRNLHKQFGTEYKYHRARTQARRVMKVQVFVYFIICVESGWGE